MTPPLLQVKGLSVSFPTDSGTVHAVRDVSFSVAPGEIFGLVGESGCGKSTLAYALLGDLGDESTRVAGQVLFKGHDLIALYPAQLERLRGAEIAMVHQNPAEALDPTMKVGKQLAEVLAVHADMDEVAACGRILELLERVHVADPARLVDRYPHELSGGQQQRVVIAMALLGNPSLLVLDEPTTGLDVTVEAAVLDLLLEIRDTLGVAMVYIAHNLGVIARVSDRVGVMYAGELVETAPTISLFDRPRHPYTIGLLRCVPRVDRPVGHDGLAPIPGSVLSAFAEPAGCCFADRCAHVRQACRDSHPGLLQVGDEGQVRCLRWHEIECEAAPPPLAADRRGPVPQREGNPLLQVDGLRVRYPVTRGRLGRRGYVRAVDGVDLTVKHGRIMAVVGESGSGKSSLGAAIIGLQRPSEGRLRFGGADITRPVSRRSATVHRLLQMIFQDHSGTLNPSVTIGGIVARPLRLFSVVQRGQVRAEAVRLLRAVGLDETTLRRWPRQLSGGQRQRVAIARAFAGRPQLVVCDEITSALDVSVQAAVLNFLLQLQRENATSLIFISHDLGVVRYLADEVAVMYLGHVCEVGAADQVFGGPNHPYTEALLSAVPLPDPRARAAGPRLRGALPSPLSPPSGCPFHTRCPRKLGPICETEPPPWREAAAGHRIWCHLRIDEMASAPRQSDTPPPETLSGAGSAHRPRPGAFTT
jgi:peptide/nickel transport system ATP-binding protein